MREEIASLHFDHDTALEKMKLGLDEQEKQVLVDMEDMRKVGL